MTGRVNGESFMSSALSPTLRPNSVKPKTASCSSIRKNLGTRATKTERHLRRISRTRFKTWIIKKTPTRTWRTNSEVYNGSAEIQRTPTKSTWGGWSTCPTSVSTSRMIRGQPKSRTPGRRAMMDGGAPTGQQQAESRADSETIGCDTSSSFNLHYTAVLSFAAPNLQFSSTL